MTMTIDQVLDDLVEQARLRAEADGGELQVSSTYADVRVCVCIVDGEQTWRVEVSKEFLGRVWLASTEKTGVRVSTGWISTGKVTQTYRPRNDGSYNVKAIRAKLLEAIEASAAYHRNRAAREARLAEVFRRYGLSPHDNRELYAVVDGLVSVHLRLAKSNALGFPGEGQVRLIADRLEPEQFDAFWQRAIELGLVEGPSCDESEAPRA